jgi:division protein CdvB (Snf7/Vps24/ESCRT-III family)
LKFAKKWKDEEKTPIQDRIKDKIRPQVSLKPRLDEANKRMQVQIRKLDTAARHFSERDKSLFAKTVQAYSKHDVMRARVYANELAELRKTKKQIDNTKLALEQISLRLGTVSEFGDVVNMLSPAVSMLKDVGRGISTAMPEAGQELGNIGNILNGIISETNQGSGIDIAFDSPTDAAQSILDEAAQMAEQNIKQQLPDIPTDTPINIPKPPERVLTKT